jgi:exoribonuclease R
MSKGALELESTEVGFVIPQGKKNPEKICMRVILTSSFSSLKLIPFIVTKQELEVNKMVAEFMIFANKSVAEKVS